MIRVTGIIASLSATLLLTGCGTLTGIPGHGGGKRFVEEQRVVSASVRGALKQIDISSMRGRRVALVFSLISDEGSGNISGGRASISAILAGASLLSPVTAGVNALEIYQLANSSNSNANTTSAGSGTSSGTVVIVSDTNGTNSNSGSNTQSGNGTSSSTSTGSSNVDTSGTSSTTGSSSTTTGATTTDQTSSSNSSSNSNTSESNSSASNGSNSNTSSGTSSSSGTSTTNTNGTETSSGNSTSNSNTDSTNQINGIQEQVVTTGTQQQTKGEDLKAGATLQYKGLGEYQNISVPKSDASLLMSLTRNYFILNGSQVTTPQDPTAELVVYVTVDIFGTNRQRTDLILYNNEHLKAETAIEMFAADRSGRIVVQPKVGNTQTSYKEEYILWAGPLKTSRDIQDGEGLLEDFTQVGGN